MDDKFKSPPSAPRKRRALAFLVGGLALLFVLATSLPGLTLWPGVPFSLPPLFWQPMLAGEASVDSTFLIVLRIILSLLLLALPIAIIWMLLNKDRRKLLLIYLLMLAVLYWLITNFVPRDNALQLDSLLNPVRPPALETSGNTPPVPSFTANPSDSAVWLATIVVVLLIVACAAGLIWLIQKRLRPSPLQALASEAQGALDAIQAGGSLEATIERCYREMCAVLQRERNVQRNASMTPSEFVQTLQGRGLPISPFQQLTRLFEDLRYGAGRAGPREEQQAVESLTAIVAACSATSRGAK